jgi:oligopeptide/dipeptide ABC transporter ATP-binding protein
MEMADRDTIYEKAQHPYTQALLSAVPLPDPIAESQRERVLLTGDLPSPLNPPSGCVFRTRCMFAQDKCASEMPIPVEIAPGHQVACHFPQTRVTKAVEIRRPHQERPMPSASSGIIVNRPEATGPATGVDFVTD